MHMERLKRAGDWCRKGKECALYGHGKIERAGDGCRKGIEWAFFGHDGIGNGWRWV